MPIIDLITPDVIKIGLTSHDKPSVLRELVQILLDAGNVSNKDDIFLNTDMKKKIKIIPAETVVDVLQSALKDSAKKKSLIQKIKKAI